MPAPRWLGRVNRVATNRVTRLVAGRLPGFGIIHEGRRSGRRYRTPVDVFRRLDGIAVALTYGIDAECVRNVLAAGHAEVVTRGRILGVVNQRVVHDANRTLVPRPIHRIIRALDVDTFFLVDEPAERR